MSLASVRAALKSSLKDSTGLPVHASVPNVMTPPCLVLRPDEPWVGSGDVYGSWQVNYVLTLYVEYGDFDAIICNIEDALPDALVGLGTEWGVTSISEPHISVIGDVQIPAVDIAIARIVADL